MKNTKNTKNTPKMPKKRGFSKHSDTHPPYTLGNESIFKKIKIKNRFNQFFDIIGAISIVFKNTIPKSIQRYSKYF